MTLTNFPNGISSFGVPVLPGVAGLPFTGNAWFVDPVNGNDGNSGQNPARAFQSLYQAVASAEDGNNDVIYLIGNGGSSGTARLSLAAAQAVNSAATTGVLNWNKSALHLVGVTAPAAVAQRARIAPPTGVYTQATFNSGNFVLVTGSGCFFTNFSLFHGFSTGGVNQICWTDNGSRNAYLNVDFGGMGDAASAADAGSRSVKIGAAGSGENAFYHCTFGLDTVSRGAANATLEFAGATPRNLFEDCLFLVETSAATPLHILGTGADCVDRVQVFKRTMFLNSIKSGSTTITEVGSLTNAAPGGLFALDIGCMTVGATKWGDTNFLANSYIDSPAPSTGGGLAVNPA